MWARRLFCVYEKFFYPNRCKSADKSQDVKAFSNTERSMNIRLLVLLSIILMSCRGSVHEVQGYVEGRYTFMSSPFSGRLDKLYVSRGDKVKKGQAIFKLDDNPEIMLLESASSRWQASIDTLNDLLAPRRAPEIQAIQAQIQQVEAQLILAQQRIARYDQLYKKGAVDKDTYDSVKARLDELQKQKTQYQANLSLAQLGDRDERVRAQKNTVHSLEAKYLQAKWELSQKSIASPADGVVFDTYYLDGEFVVSAHPVVSLLFRENITVVWYLPLTAVEQIHVGQKISFREEEGQRSFSTTIQYISPDAEYVPPLVYSRENSDKIVFRVEAACPSEAPCKPGQPVLVQMP